MSRQVICGGEGSPVENLVVRVESLRGRYGQDSAILLLDPVTIAEVSELL